jgi:hypothetical protein
MSLFAFALAWSRPRAAAQLDLPLMPAKQCFPKIAFGVERHQPQNRRATVTYRNGQRTQKHWSQSWSEIAAWTILMFGLASVLVGCGGGSSNSTPPPPSGNPVPSVASISPSSGIAGGVSFTLTVNGSNFVSASTVQWNGSNRATSYVGGTQVTATITAADIATAGTGSVTVVNPAPGGGTSTAATFATNDPVPAITSLSPASASTGAATFTLTVNGSNFVSNSTVQWNGASRTTAYVSPVQLTASITAADIAAAGTANVAVVNPAPGGGTSGAVSFSTTDPVPVVTSLSPSTTASGGAAFTLTLNGSNFISTSAVQWNGSSRATTYLSATQLTASITAADIAIAGSANVAVINPAPGGGTSAVAGFTVSGTIPNNVFFVAPTGSDSNPGTITMPYLTIQKCATTAASGSTCAIRAGTYHETVTPNSGITITSYDGESVTVDGSDPVGGWTLYQGSIYKASVTLSTGDTNQVFVGSQMMTEARWPNGDDLFHVNWATAQTGTTDTMVVDSNLPNIDWTGAKIHLWSGTDPWSPQTGAVTASGAGQVSFSVDGASYSPPIEPIAGGYYYLFGILGALDTQKEWFYDSKAKVLYFWAPGSLDPNTLDVRAKQRQFAFDLRVKSNVTIQNVDLFASTINTDASSANNTLNGINAQYVSHFTSLPDQAGSPHSYWYAHNSDSGIVINGTGNVLENSTIAYSAGNGVALIGSSNTIKNNLINHIDYIANFCSGITLTFSPSSGNEIENNTIYATGRSAIQVNAGNNEDISYNNFFDAMMLSRDGGEIYSSVPGGAATGTHIHNNWFHDTQSLVTGPADNYSLSGVYLDEDTNGVEVDQNVFWNNQYYNIQLRGSNLGVTSPNNNNVHNNTIPDASSFGYILTALNSTCGTTQIVDNLVLVPLIQSGTVCPATDNNSTAPGATQMNSSVQVGCNFAGCSSSGPPVISGSSVAASIAVQPLSVAVTAGQTATFTIRAAGSPTLSYQWQKKGTNISGATSTTYTTPATTAADNGAMFTVQVGNSVGSATSTPATLTVQ